MKSSLVFYLTTWTLSTSKLKKETKKYICLKIGNKYYFPEMAREWTNPETSTPLGKDFHIENLPDTLSKAWCIKWSNYFMARCWHKREGDKKAMQSLSEELEKCFEQYLDTENKAILNIQNEVAKYAKQYEKLFFKKKK